MKMLVGLMSFALSFASIASSGETKSFIYDGTQNGVELLLRGEKTHTEYRYENRQTTCYRTEIIGYRTVCNGGYGYPGPGPRPFPGPRPYPGPTNCYRTPIYGQVAYSCTQTVQIPYEVKDYDVEARVLVDVRNLSRTTTPGETFIVALNGDSLTLTASGSKKFLLIQKKNDLRSMMNGSVKFLDAFYAVEMIEAAPILSAIKTSSIVFANPVFSFNLKDAQNLAFALKVVKNRRFGSDIIELNRELAAGEVEMRTAEAGAVVSTSIDKLGVNTADAKLTLTGKVSFRTVGTLLNAFQFGNELSSEKTIIFNNRN